MPDDVTVIRGDCLVEMAGIADGSIDLICADLPYGVSECRWDQIIPLGPLWDHYRRVLKPRGAVVLTASQPFTSMLVTSNPGWFKYCRVWEKSQAVANNARHRPPMFHEDIVVFSPADCGNGCAVRMTYNPQGLVWCGRTMKNRVGGIHAHHRPGRSVVVRELFQEWTNYPGSIIRIPCEGPSTDRFHSTQKPVALMEYLIRTYSDPGDVVLDSCMGSGTTGLACMRTGRRFIGIEKDPEIFATAVRRLDGPPMPLFDDVPPIAADPTPLFAALTES